VMISRASPPSRCADWNLNRMDAASSGSFLQPRDRHLILLCITSQNAPCPKPRRIVDHAAKWTKFEPVGSVNGELEQRVRAFCASKRVTLAYAGRAAPVS
jgi:hypothetical protein